MIIVNLTSQIAEVINEPANPANNRRLRRICKKLAAEYITRRRQELKTYRVHHRMLKTWADPRNAKGEIRARPGAVEQSYETIKLIRAELKRITPRKR